MNTRSGAICLILCVLTAFCSEPAAGAQEPNAPQSVSPAQLKAAIDKLGDLDYPTRMNAARTVRRTPAAQAVPALIQAVSEHKDGYVRYRALVLLTGFNDPRTKDAMRQSLAKTARGAVLAHHAPAVAAQARLSALVSR